MSDGVTECELQSFITSSLQNDPFDDHFVIRRRHHNANTVNDDACDAIKQSCLPETHTYTSTNHPSPSPPPVPTSDEGENVVAFEESTHNPVETQGVPCPSPNSAPNDNDNQSKTPSKVALLIAKFNQIANCFKSGSNSDVKAEVLCETYKDNKANEMVSSREKQPIADTTQDEPNANVSITDPLSSVRECGISCSTINLHSTQNVDESTENKQNCDTSRTVVKLMEREQHLFHEQLDSNGKSETQKEQDLEDAVHSTQPSETGDSCHHRSHAKPMIPFLINRTPKQKEPLGLIGRPSFKKLSLVDVSFSLNSKTLGSSPMSGMALRGKTFTIQCNSTMDEGYPPISQFLKSKKTTPTFHMESRSDWKRKVYDLCDQKSPIPISLIFCPMKTIFKVGEGVFGEVYVASYTDAVTRVYKVVPIEGLKKVNGEKQKTYAEIFPEIFVTKELSKLHDGYHKGCKTSGFAKLHNVRIATGHYPRVLQETWNAWHKIHDSDNDLPEFSKDQLYMIFEFDYGGKDAEAFPFYNARQAFHLVFHIIYTLAVGEESLEFEHRDLHWGNILVQATSDAEISFVINGVTYNVPSGGIKACIIDFTIARMVNDRKVPVFLDLQDDEEQFLGTGDHQFNIYRMMRDRNRNNWAPFCPETNIYWIHYLADKLVSSERYSEPQSHEHEFFIKQLKFFRNDVLKYDSCMDFVRNSSIREWKLDAVTGDSTLEDMSTNK